MYPCRHSVCPKLLVPLFSVMFLVLSWTGSSAFGAPLAADQFHWKYVKFAEHWGKSYPFRVQGPATITIRWGMQPFDILRYSNRSDPVFRHNLEPGAAGLEFVRGEELFDGKPLASYKVSSSHDLAGKVKIYTASSTWKLPAGKSFDGVVHVSAPGVATGWWTQHASDAWFEVIPGAAGPRQTDGTPGPGEPERSAGRFVRQRTDVFMRASPQAGWTAVAVAGSDPKLPMSWKIGEVASTRREAGKLHAVKLWSTTPPETWAPGDSLALKLSVRVNDRSGTVPWSATQAAYLCGGEVGAGALSGCQTVVEKVTASADTPAGTHRSSQSTGPVTWRAEPCTIAIEASHADRGVVFLHRYRWVEGK